MTCVYSLLQTRHKDPYKEIKGKVMRMSKSYVGNHFERSNAQCGHARQNKGKRDIGL